MNISNPHLYSYYHVTSSGEPASYTWTLASAVTGSGGVARYSGVDTSNPSDAPVSVISSATAVSGLTVPAVTTVSSGALLVGGAAINSSSASVVITAPGGMTEKWDLGGKRQEYDDAPQASPGSSGDKTWAFSAPREAAAWLAALRPASGFTSLAASRVSTGINPMLQCDMNSMRSDVTGDGYWNGADVTAIVGLFGQAVERGTRADIHPSTPDGFVDVADLAMIAGALGPNPLQPGS